MSRRSSLGRRIKYDRKTGIHEKICSYSDALYEVDQSIWMLVQTIFRLHLASVPFKRMSKQEQKVWLRHTITILKSLNRMQQVLLYKYDIIFEHAVLDDKLVKTKKLPNEFVFVDKLYLLKRWHPIEWKKIRLLLHELYTYPTQKQKMLQSHTVNNRTRPWLSPVLVQRPSNNHLHGQLH